MRSMLIGAAALALGGAVLAPAAAGTTITHEATAAEDGYADVVVTTGSELAGEWLSVLVIDEDADATAPAAGDIVFVEQRELDDDGTLTFRVLLPSADLGAYDIALNTAAGTQRYLAPLDGVADPDPEPTDEPTGSPTEEPSEEPTEEPSEEPSDGATGGPSTPGHDDDDGAGGAGADGGGTGTDGSGSDGGGAGADGPGGSGSAGEGAGGRLSQTGAPVVVAVVVALAAIAGGVLLRARRSRA